MFILVVFPLPSGVQCPHLFIHLYIYKPQRREDGKIKPDVPIPQVQSLTPMLVESIAALLSSILPLSSSSQDYFLLLFTSLFYNLFKSPPEDMFVDFRKRGREGERERNFSLLPGAHTPTGDQTQNLGMCPEGVKPTTFSSAGRHSTN